jgi:NADH-quinone oxidoreductase subunit K
MANVPVEHVLIFAAGLFALGLLGVLVRRNLIFTLMSLEVMLNGAGLAFIGAGSRWMQPDGQILFLFLLAVAAAEVSIGLAMLLLFRRCKQSLDVDESCEMRG